LFGSREFDNWTNGGRDMHADQYSGAQEALVDPGSSGGGSGPKVLKKGAAGYGGGKKRRRY